MKSAIELAEVFCRIKDPTLMLQFFTEIFTPAEIDDFVLRWRLMEMLSDGMTQREISSRLGISLCKITRGAKVLKSGRSVTEKILNESASGS